MSLTYLWLPLHATGLDWARKTKFPIRSRFSFLFPRPHKSGHHCERADDVGLAVCHTSCRSPGYEDESTLGIPAMLILVALFAAFLAPAAPKVIAVNVDSVVHPITVEIVGHAIEQAGRENATAVLLRLNTPGGLLDATREINSRIVASRVPVIAYVTPSGGRAASAGFFLLEAADVAAMAPGTNTGASSPVLLGEQMDPVMGSKVENDTSPC